MKICIVTVYNYSNCGSVLQAYSLKRLLETLGHETVFLKTRIDAYVKNLLYSTGYFFRSVIKYPFWGISRYRYRYRRKAYQFFSAQSMKFNEANSIKQADVDLYLLGSVKFGM